MTINTVRFEINSLRVDKEFLEKLGAILEKEIKTKKDKSWYFTEYKIHSKGETREFSSMKELLSSSVFPQTIRSMDFRIGYENKEYVNIDISLDNNSFSISTCNLSSKDGSKIPAFEKDIKGLFNEYETGYNWVYKIPIDSFWLYLLFPTISVIAFIKIVNMLAILAPSTEKWLLLFFIPLSMLLTSTTDRLFKFLYPRYSFELSKKDNSRTLIKTVIGGVILSIVSALIYDYLVN